MIELTGRRVLVTGGSRGIGAACCRRFASAGASVAVHFRVDRAAAEALVEACRASGREAIAIQADLAESGGPERLFDLLADSWDGLDCLVNNAGVWQRNPMEELDRAGLEATWALNVDAVFGCASLALPLLRESPDGNIVNISSTAAQRGEAFHSPYAASKGALIAATKSWSTELAPSVRVNAVAPGWVDTDMCVEAFAGPERGRIERTIPLGRVATADDIAGPVVFLASPLASHITGEILNVNGGSVLAG